ncbi:MAG: glycosyl hydrolase family 18 protein [Blautia sp.]
MSKGRRRRRRNRIVSTLVIILLIIVVAAVGIIMELIKRRTPSDERMDLNTYYDLAQQDEVALVLQNDVSDQKGKIIDGHVYLDYETVTDVLEGRFYWDEKNQQMLYCTPSETIVISPDSNVYTAGGEEKEQDYIIVCKKDDKIYLALEFIEQYMKITTSVSEEPNKAVIQYKWGKTTTVTVTEDTVLRYRGGVKSEILTDLPAGTEITLIDTLDNWLQVATADGFNGYVDKKKISEPKEKETVYQGSFQEEYTSLTRDYKINLAWHQVTSENANDALAQTLENVKGVNVISPTWFSLSDNDGSISSLASEAYVNTAHDAGMEVWGLIDNFNSNVSTMEVLSDRSAREHTIQKLLEEAQRVGMDGINVDFEALKEEEAPHFLQFIRELSIVCRANNLVLSIDDPVPYVTEFYNRKEQGIVADYVIIMGYDENTDGTKAAGSVSSLPFVEEGIVQTLQEVPAKKVINGMPFYTRMWYTDTSGSVTSEVMGMNQAGQAVEEKGMVSGWDENTSQNYAELETGSGKYQIWLEDEQSIDAKMQLFEKYELAGVAEWKLGFERASIWNVIYGYFQ